MGEEVKTKNRLRMFELRKQYKLECMENDKKTGKKIDSRLSGMEKIEVPWKTLTKKEQWRNSRIRKGLTNLHLDSTLVLYLALT